MSLTCCGGTTAAGTTGADGGPAAEGGLPAGQTAAGAGTCPTTADAYCAGTKCPTTPTAWCTDGGIGYLQPAIAAGACSNGTTWIQNMASVDQANDYFYDPSGKLIAIAGWESNPPCHGACRYVCIAGPADFDPSKVVTCADTATWERNVDADGGSVPMPACGR